MKWNRLLFLLPLAVAVTVPGNVSGQGFRRLSVTQAEKLVASWVKANVRGPFNWHKKPPLKEITTKEIEERLRAQIFRLDDYTGSVDESDAYIIRGGKVFPFSMGFGGSGLGSMSVCDLNGDGSPELAYTYSWGSGLHRSHVELICFDGNAPPRIVKGFVVGHVDLFLRRSSDRLIKVYVLRSKYVPKLDFQKTEDILMGNLKLTKGKRGRKLEIVFENGLAKKWRELLWK